MAVWTKQLVRHGMAVKAVGVLIAALILIFFVVVPLYKNISTVGSKISSREKEAAELSNKVAILTGLDREVLKERVKVLDAALPPKKDVLLYLSTVDGLSRELGLVFSGISLSPGDVTDASAAGTKKKVDDTVPGVHTLETDVKMTGDKDSIYSFLRAIEQSLPLMQVKDVKVTSSGKDGQYSLSLRLGMLWASGNLASVKGPITLFDEKEEGFFQQLSGYKEFTPIVRDNSATTGGGKTNLFAPVVINQVEAPVKTATESAVSQ